MPKQVVRLWESVLGQLAALSQISSTTPADLSLQHDGMLRIKALLNQVLTSDTPQSAWKRIINDMKVPHAIAAVLKHQPGKPAPSYAVQIACVDSLVAFSRNAESKHLQGVFANAASSVSAQYATGLALSAVTQLQQSGVLELLPQLLSDAAAALAGLSDAAILAWAAGTAQDGSDLLLGGSMSGSVAILQNHACASYRLFNMVWEVWPFTDTVKQQVLGPSLLPALQLVTTMHQFVGRCADLLPADPEQINPRTLSEMQCFVMTATVVLSGALYVALQAGLTAFDAAQNRRAGQDTASLGLAPGRPSETAAALGDDPGIKAAASASLLGACCLSLMNALSADMLQPLVLANLEAHKSPADTTASMGVAAGGVDGSSSSNAAGTRSRQNPIEDNIGAKHDAAAWQLACSDTLQLPSPFTHMLSLLGYSRRALTLMAIQNSTTYPGMAAGFAAQLTAAPRQRANPYPSPGTVFQMISACLQLAGVARQSPAMAVGTIQRLCTFLRTAAAAKLAAEQQQQHGQPEPHGNDMPNQQQCLEQQQTKTNLDAEWEAQMHHTLLAVVLVWLGQKDVNANSYAESLSDAAGVLSRVIGRIGQESNLAAAEVMMQSAPYGMQAEKVVQEQLAPGIKPVIIEPALAQGSVPGQFQDQRLQPAASPWFTPAMQEVGLVQLLSTACQQLLGHLDSLPTDSTAAAHTAGQTGAARQGSSSSSSSRNSSSTSPSGSTSSNLLGNGGSGSNRSKGTSSNRSGGAGGRGSSSSSGGGGGGAGADTLKALSSVAESISLLAGMSLPDRSCKGYRQGTPAENPFCNLLAPAQKWLQNAVYLHHSTTSQAYTTWRQHFVRLASVLELHVRVSASSNSPLLKIKNVLTAGSCLLNPEHPVQLRPGKWVGKAAMDAALQAGPGSREEQQLFSLACSLLKACSIRLMGGQLQPHERAVIEAHMMVIGTMACSLIMRATRLLKSQGADSGMPSGGTPTAAAASSTSSGVSLVPGTVSSSGSSSSSRLQCMVSGTVDTGRQCGTTTGNTGRSAVLVVPWLVLLGPFCVCCSSHALTCGVKDSPQEAPGSTQETARTELLLIQQQAGCAVSVCRGDPSILSELAAAGYDTVALASELAAAQAAAVAAAQAAAVPELSSPTTTAASGPAAVQYLRSMGLALTKLPFKLACNNPSCSDMAGLSELQLGSGRARCCSGCRVARYCSEACQRKHWKQHKPACKALAAAAAAPGAAAT